MIDTQEKLDKAVDAYRALVLIDALKEFAETGDYDVWGTHWVDKTEPFDFNIYEDEETGDLTVWAYALQHEIGDPEDALTINTEISTFVARVKWRE